MAHHLHAQLDIKGVWGDVRRAFRLASASPKALRAAERRGGLRGVSLYGNISDKDGELEILPVGLDFDVTFTDAYNAISQWTTDSTASGFFANYPNQFQTAGVGYANQGTSTTPAYFVTADATDGGFPMLENCSFAGRYFIPKPPTEKCVFTLARWDGWQIQLVHGSPHAMRFKPAWTQTAEDALHTLLAIDSPTDVQQNAIADAREALYYDYKSLSKLGNGERWYGQQRLLVLIPEPHGVIRIWDGHDWDKAENSAQLKLRTNGTMWHASRVTVGTSGPSIFWQLGYPVFKPTGRLNFKDFPTPSRMDGGTTFTYTMVSVYNQTIGTSHDGTALTPSASVGTYRSNAYVDFTTTNTRYTPLLYSFDALVPAGTRTGDETVVWTSEDYLDGDGNAPFLDVVLSCEAENRRKTYTITLFDYNGVLFRLLGDNYDSGQWRLFDYYEGGTLLIKNGLIIKSALSDMPDSTYNQTRAEVTSGGSLVTLTCCDAWAFLDQHVIVEEPKGDGLKEGGFIRQILNLTGTPSGEYTGVGASTGRACGAARAGEDWVTVAKAGTRAGDYLRERVKRRSVAGRAMLLTHGNGWTLGDRSDTIFQIAGQDAAFSSTRTIDLDNYPGRFVAWDLTELSWDLCDFCNEIVIVGGEDYDGESIVQVQRLNGSINQVGAVQGLNYVGMPVRYEVRAGDSRTAADVALDRRAIADSLMQPPVYRAFGTTYHSGLYCGALVTIDGAQARVARILESSWQQDSMRLAVRMTGL